MILAVSQQFNLWLPPLTLNPRILVVHQVPLRLNWLVVRRIVLLPCQPEMLQADESHYGYIRILH